MRPFALPSLVRPRRAVPVVVAALASLVLSACGGVAGGTTKITTTSATLNATGHCDAGESCKWYWEWWKASSARSTSVKSAVSGPVTNATADVPLTFTTTGLTPNTRYRWVLCGSPNNGAGYGCVGPKRQVTGTTGEPSDYQQFVTHQVGGTKGIAFASHRDGNDEIYRMNADGSGQTRLTNNPASDFEPAWSPDGTKIVFVTNRDGDEEIYAMGALGTSPTNITKTAGSDEVAPAWSPDGTKIAYADAASATTSTVWSMNPDGSGKTDLTPNRNALEPTWSPDGSKIAFVDYVVNDPRIWVMNADGSNQTPISPGMFNLRDPAWSPDGLLIAFSASPAGSEHQIYLTNANGGGTPARITNEAGADRVNHDEPSWSADNTKIAYNRGSPAEIVTISNSGGTITNLTNNPADDFSPSWSPIP
jgi:Tol biopolymer transport system component